MQPPGYWSIATQSRAASNALCAFDVSFGAGLLEAVTQVAVDQTRVLLIAYDVPYPQPLHAKRPIPEAFGGGICVSAGGGRRGHTQAGSGEPVGSNEASPAPHAGGGSLGRLTVRLADSPVDRMRNTDLEALRVSIPAARSLPLLYQLAVRKPGVVNIEYLDGRSLAVEVDPCA